jgi:hypothetical protein
VYKVSTPIILKAIDPKANTASENRLKAKIVVVYLLVIPIYRDSPKERPVDYTIEKVV